MRRVSLLAGTVDTTQREDVLWTHQQIDGAKEQSQDERQDHRTGEVVVVHPVILGGKKVEHENTLFQNIGTDIDVGIFLFLF